MRWEPSRPSDSAGRWERRSEGRIGPPIGHQRGSWPRQGAPTATRRVEKVDLTSPPLLSWVRDTAPTRQRANIELVRRLYGELASEGSPLKSSEQRLTDDALGHFLDPGIEWVPVAHSLLAVESYRGLDGVRRFWGEFVST